MVCIVNEFSEINCNGVGYPMIHALYIILNSRRNYMIHALSSNIHLGCYTAS